jgi:hypothetical protein
MSRRLARVRPGDECPWPKPFPEGFDGCAAFQQSHFIPLDSRYQLLDPVLTCRHLVIRQQPDLTSRWYPACEIGDQAARLRWVEDVDGQWLSRMAALRSQMETINRPFIQRIWQAKAAQLAAGVSGEARAAATEEIRRLADQFIEQCQAFVSDHAGEFAALQLPPGAVIELLQNSLRYFIEQRTTDARWEIPDTLLGRFPEPVQRFFRPRLTRA